MADASVPSVDTILAWESAQKTRTGLLALVAGNLALFGSIATTVKFKDFPQVSSLDGLRDAAGEKLAAGPGLQSTQLFFFHDNQVSLLLIAIVVGIGFAAMAPVLGYLFRAASGRGAPLPRIALYGALVGPLLVAVGTIVYQIGISIDAADFVSAKDYSTDASRDAIGSSVVTAAQAIRQIGILLLVFSVMIVSLNAMRVGLLTRFLGILGMIAGAVFIIPLGGNVPIVQCAWFVALGFLIMDRGPGAARPSAWASGTAQPWPSQQDIREQRDAASAAARGEDPDAETTSAVAGAGVNLGKHGSAASAAEDGLPGTAARRPDGVPHPASKKRKNRKRR